MAALPPLAWLPASVLPAEEVTVTTAPLETRLPTESSMRTTGWAPSSAPLAAPTGWVVILSLAAGPAIVVILALVPVSGPGLVAVTVVAVPASVRVVKTTVARPPALVVLVAAAKAP